MARKLYEITFTPFLGPKQHQLRNWKNGSGLTAKVRSYAFLSSKPPSSSKYSMGLTSLYPTPGIPLKWSAMLSRTFSTVWPISCPALENSESAAKDGPSIYDKRKMSWSMTQPSFQTTWSSLKMKSPETRSGERFDGGSETEYPSPVSVS